MRVRKNPVSRRATRRPTMNPIRLLSSPLFLLLAVLVVPAFAPPARGAEPEEQPKMDSVQLPKFTVKGEAVCSFGFGVTFTRDPETLRVRRVLISKVSPGSAAEQRGLQVGDEIMAINGEKVAGMEGEIKRGKKLFDLLADREPGDTVDLDVTVRVAKKITLRAGIP